MCTEFAGLLQLQSYALNRRLSGELETLQKQAATKLLRVWGKKPQDIGLRLLCFGLQGFRAELVALTPTLPEVMYCALLLQHLVCGSCLSISTSVDTHG